MMGYDGGNWWAWIAMSVGMLAFWGLVLWGVVYFVKGGSGTSRRTADDILRERFATGEIDEQEFRRRSDALRRPDVSTRA
jgi:putative membrane protein